MPRLPRVRVHGNQAWYHVHNHAAAKEKEFPLAHPTCKQKLISLIKFYTNAYFCKTAGFIVLGNHFHLVLRFEAPRSVSREELWTRAVRLYPHRLKWLKRWTEKEWLRLQIRLFDLSELMRNILGTFATWYNKTFSRKGHFWGDRFKSTLLTTLQAALECLKYVELNALRAGLIERPEDWEYSSLYLREQGAAAADWLMPLECLLGAGPESEYSHFKRLVYHRGAVPTKEGQAAIRPGILTEEEDRGFQRRGAFLNRVPCFTRGIVVGDSQSIKQHHEQLRSCGVYRRERDPVAVEGSQHFCLRPTRY